MPFLLLWHPKQRVPTGNVVAASNRKDDDEALMAVLMSALPALCHRRVRARSLSRSSSRVRARTPR